MLLRQIRHFQAIIQENSFSLAADRCHISQSGISQSIQSLEFELGVKLIERKNRGFTLTKAGEYFYRKSLIITADLDQLCRETIRIDRKDTVELSLGLLSTYSGDEFNRAIAAFSGKYPEVELKVISGNHEDLYDALREGRIDLAFNDQRRAFSDAYENLILTETDIFAEMSVNNPLYLLDSVEVDEMKNLSCILVASPEQQDEESNYFSRTIGVRSDFLFAGDLQSARVMTAANRGYMIVNGADPLPSFENVLIRIPLTRDGIRLKQVYCAFWKKNTINPYVSSFASIFRSIFESH